MILTPQQPTLALHARNAAESAHPELWRGLVGAWVPALGYQGSVLYDMSGHNIHLPSSGADSPLWVNGSRGHAVDFMDGLDQKFVNSRPAVAGVPCTLAVLFRRPTNSNLDWNSIYLKIGTGTSNNRIVLEITGTNRLDYTVRRFSGALTRIDPAPRGEWCIAFGRSRATNDHQLTLYCPSKGREDAFGSGDEDPAPSQSIVEGKDQTTGLAYVWDYAITDAAMEVVARDPLAPFRLRDDTALATAAMFGETPSVTIPPPLLNMQMTGSF